MKYLKMSAFVLLYLSVYFILQNYVGIIIALVYTVKELVTGGTNINTLHLTASLIKNSVYIVIISALLSFAVYWFAFWLRKESILYFCRFSRISISNMFLSALLGVSLILPVQYLVSLASLDKLSPTTQKFFNTIIDGNNIFVLIVSIGIIGPVIEEIIFRGLIFNELHRNMPMVVALLIQAFLFGVYHLNLTQAIYAFALGIILGLVYVWTKSIWSSILLHIFFNSTSVILSKLPQWEPAFINNVGATFLSFLAVIATCSLILSSKRKLN